MQKQNKTSPYLIPNWQAPSNIRAYSTTRLIGYSQGPYAAFNLSLKTGDRVEDVIKNRNKLKNDLNLPHEPLWLNQIHGNHAIDISEQTSTPDADACFTSRSNSICAIQTADCLPILICQQQGKEIAAIHGGWRGLLSGVIENTIHAMHSPPNELLAWLGPAIGPQYFEVNKQIEVDFLNSNPQNSDCFIHKNKRVFADLYKIAKNNLRSCGVLSISGGQHCTFHEATLFYSYRRDQGITGRMASLIWIAEP